MNVSMQITRETLHDFLSKLIKLMFLR